jgi:hypothetical protein
MHLRRLSGILLVSCLLSWSLLAPLAVLAMPAAQSDCPGNALVNPGFEDGYSDRGAGEVSVANGWFPWWQDGPRQEQGYFRRPEYKPEDARRYGTRRIHSGTFAQKFFNTYSTHNAGILQQVQVPVGSKLTFSAWVQAWSSQDPDPGTFVSPGNYRVYVGVDSTGGTVWDSPNVVWSEPRMEYNTWMRLEIQAVAKAGTITVFLRGQPEFRNQFNDSYWDDACLTVVRPPTATPRPTNTPKDTPTPTPSPTPTDTPTPEASPTPTSTPTPAPGSVCVSAFDDGNGNGRRDDGERLIPGAVVSLSDITRLELDRYTTDGLSEPFCFSALAEGTYYLKRVNPAGYVSTAPDDWAAAVVPGGKTMLEFGARFVPTPTATATATRTATPTATPTPKPILKEVASVTYQVSGILLAALALIIPVGLRFLRRHL